MKKAAAQRLDTVEKAAALEKEACESRHEALRFELRDVSASLDALLLASKHAPERMPEIAADVLERRKALTQPSVTIVAG